MMRQKSLLVIFILFLSFGILGSNFCLAKLNTPTNTQVVAVGEGSAKVSWEWPPGGGTINRFVLSYRIAGTDEEWTKRYPSAGVRDYTIMGLIENTPYEWTIMAEAVNPADNSRETSGDNFTTLSGGVNGDNGGGNGGGIPIGLINPLQAETLGEAINALINFLFYLAMAIAPILIIYAAFLLLTAAGDAAKINKARTIILWTLIAVAIVLLAKGLPAIIKGAMGG